MTTQAADTETFEDEYESYDEYDDENGEESGGLSGLVVLLMGVVMLGAFASVVWIAYQQGIKTGGERGPTPFVAADPEPLKIENDAAREAAAGDGPAVYDRFEGGANDEVEVIAEAPEEPVIRNSSDPIADIAADTTPAGVEDAVADRIASLAAADEELGASEPQASVPPPPTRETQAPAQTQQPAATRPAASNPAPAAGGALSGSHIVQVGAFGSDAEAMGVWSRLQGRLGDYLSGKSPDVEMADLGDRGVFYRLRVGPFASSDAAKTYCEGLKSRGQDCLVKAK